MSSGGRVAADHASARLWREFVKAASYPGVEVARRCLRAHSEVAQEESKTCSVIPVRFGRAQEVRQGPVGDGLVAQGIGAGSVCRGIVAEGRSHRIPGQAWQGERKGAQTR